MSWQNILGHEARVQAFAHALRQSRFAHAYLLVGPEGVGKSLFARQLAKTLLCEQSSDNFASCNQCPSCLLVDAGTHPDLFIVRKPEESNELPIELMRELRAGFMLKSARGHGKIAIIEDADDLNEESANAFLKTLEEPPPRSLFLLIGTSPDHQLPTILSRSHTVRFPPLAEADVRAILTGQGIDEPLLSRVVRRAGGSPGVALKLADPALWDFRQKFLPLLVDPRAEVAALGKMWLHFIEEAGKEGAQQRQRARLTLRLVVDFLRDALAHGLGIPAPAEDQALLASLVARATPEKIIQLLDRALETEKHIDRYIQLALVLEAFLDAFTV